MKVLISKIWLSLTVGVLLSCGVAHALKTDRFAVAVQYCADLPQHLEDAVTNFRELPERLDPTCSECN